MKKVLLLAILLFPVLTLAAWLYWGSRPAQAIPNSPARIVRTNAPAAVPPNP